MFDTASDTFFWKIELNDPEIKRKILDNMKSYERKVEILEEWKTFSDAIFFWNASLDRYSILLDSHLHLIFQNATVDNCLFKDRYNRALLNILKILYIDNIKLFPYSKRHAELRRRLKFLEKCKWTASDSEENENPVVENDIEIFDKLTHRIALHLRKNATLSIFLFACWLLAIGISPDWMSFKANVMEKNVPSYLTSAPSYVTEIPAIDPKAWNTNISTWEHSVTGVVIDSLKKNFPKVIEENMSVWLVSFLWIFFLTLKGPFQRFVGSVFDTIGLVLGFVWSNILKTIDGLLMRIIKYSYFNRYFETGWIPFILFEFSFSNDRFKDLLNKKLVSLIDFYSEADNVNELNRLFDKYRNERENITEVAGKDQKGLSGEMPPIR